MSTDEKWDRRRALTGSLELARDALRLAANFADDEETADCVYEATLKLASAIAAAESSGKEGGS